MANGNRSLPIPKLARHAWPVIFLCLILVLVLDSCREATEPSVQVREKFIHSATELGVPTDQDASDDRIIERFQYTLSYNPGLNVANWVSWNEDSAWYGPADRCDCFKSDPNLPGDCTPIPLDLYSKSGYDRANKELYIIAGGLYKTKKRIKDLVTIPDSCWKIVVVMDRGYRLADVNSSNQVIAVMMNNGDYTKDNNDWRFYKTTVRAIEQSTGYNFLSSVPKAVQDVIETKIN